MTLRPDIRIVKVSTPVTKGALRFRCDRQTPLGNPHPMKVNTLPERNRVCDAFVDYMARLRASASWKDSPQRAALLEIQGLASHHPVELACHCFPLRCHCETIRHIIIHDTL